MPAVVGSYSIKQSKAVSFLMQAPSVLMQSVKRRKCMLFMHSLICKLNYRPRSDEAILKDDACRSSRRQLGVQRPALPAESAASQLQL